VGVPWIELWLEGSALARIPGEFHSTGSFEEAREILGRYGDRLTQADLWLDKLADSPSVAIDGKASEVIKALAIEEERVNR
jgi:hypothetical protein